MSIGGHILICPLVPRSPTAVAPKSEIASRMILGRISPRLSTV